MLQSINYYKNHLKYTLAFNQQSTQKPNLHLEVQDALDKQVHSKHSSRGLGSIWINDQMHNALNEGQMPSNGRGEQPKPPSPKVAAQMPPGTDEIHVHFLNLPKFSSTWFTCASLRSRCSDISWCIETISSRRQRTWPSSLCSSLASPGMPIMRWCSIRRTEKIHTWAFCLNCGSSKYTCNANSECNTSVKNFLPSNDQYLGLPASFTCECLKFWLVKLPLSIKSAWACVKQDANSLFLSL